MIETNLWRLIRQLRWLRDERTRLVGYALRFLLSRFVRFTGLSVARRLRRRADAARDAHRHDLAAALYEEALHFLPGDQRTHLQAGHMYKEAGDHAQAELHYLDARRVGPRTADLALQLGHFFKVAGRVDEAETAYEEALALRPGWPAALEEYTRTRTALDPQTGALILKNGADPDMLVPELMPRGRSIIVHHDTLQIRRLGASRARSRWGTLKVLRGIEAIRGFCIASKPLSMLHVLVNGILFHVEPLQDHPLEGAGPARCKYVFNAWCDFSDVPTGRTTIELRVVDVRGKVVRLHRETLLIASPVPEIAHPRSDALVEQPPGNGALNERINARPSMVRSAKRSLLVEPIRTILIQRTDQMGDMVCSLPALRRVRALFPSARLVGLVTAANADLARSFHLFDEIVEIDFPVDRMEGRRLMPLAEQQGLRVRLAAYRIDLAIDLGESVDSRPLLLLSGARFLAGFKDRDFPWLSIGFDFNGHDPVNRLEIMPPARKLLALVEAIGTMLHPAAQIARDPALDRSRLARLGQAMERRYAVLHSGARLAYSRWPFFADLAVQLIDQTDLALVLFEDDPLIAEQIARKVPPERLTVITGQMPFADFDAILSFCTVFVGNDSGPKHLAALRGVPVISLHMARVNWSEWGQEIGGVIISRRVPCAGCGIGDQADECGKDFACLRYITPDEVFAAIQHFI